MRREVVVELIGHVLGVKRLERLGSGDPSACEALADMHHDELVAIDGRLRLPAGSSEASLRSWIIEGRGVGRPARSVLEVLLGCTARKRLVDDAWSPVHASTVDELDAALQKHGLPRNSTLRKLARPACGASNRPLALDDGLLRVLFEGDLHAHEAAWASAIARLGLDAARSDEHRRALAVQAWWGSTRGGLEAIPPWQRGLARSPARARLKERPPLGA
jgi:hypothetical protein